MDLPKQQTNGRAGSLGGQSHEATTKLGLTVDQGGVQTRFEISPQQQNISLNISWNQASAAPTAAPAATTTAAHVAVKPVVPPPKAIAAPSPSTPSTAPPPTPSPAKAPAASSVTSSPPSGSGPRSYTLEDVSHHNKESDCWVVINGQVLDVTSFLHEHPGGKKAILLYAGKDASEEFNMLHKPNVIEKYAPQSVIGVLAKSGKIPASL
jgi:predicted heme/steroid binding protein